MNKQERTYGFDYLRAFACLCIILLHTTYSTTLMYASEYTARQTLISQMVMNNLMWCVPCFIMVTGALLLPPVKELTYGALFKKYIARVLKAIVVFGVIFLLSVMAFAPARRTFAYFFQGLYKIFTGDTWSHMWYLYCLIGLYLLLPFYKKAAALSEEKDIRYLLIVYAIFLSILPQVNAFSVRCGFYIHVSSIYPFWLFLGYYLHRYGMGRSRRFYVLLFAAGTAALLILTWVRSRWNVAALDNFFEYSSCLVIVQAAGIAGWFFQCRQEGFRGVKTVLTHIDRHSFGIYLIHMMFVRLLYKHIHFDPFAFGSAWFLGILAVVAISFLLSYILDMLLKKLPLFRGIL